MKLKLYNTMSRDLTEVEPINPGRIGLYACGPTVYDHAHIGHARATVAFDVLNRYLLAQGLEVNYVRNFTDVDDKILKRAQELNRPWLELAEEHIDSFNQDMGALGCHPPTHAPRATDYIAQMLEDVQQLVDQNNAYVIEGDVYFDVASLPDYGQLSGRKLSEQEAGARVSVNSLKKNPADFALWKAASPEEPSWPSPWGPGRPGWHTECAAMSSRLLGPSFDIHGGGQDLIFPHHENELAQAKALGRPMAKIWAHNGFINVNHEKMSKSLGNAFNVKDVLKVYPPEILRFFLVSKHYRGPLDFSEEALLESWRALERIYRALATPVDSLPPQAKEPLEVTKFRERFFAALDDDLNTSQAIGVAFDLARSINRLAQRESAELLVSHYRRALFELGELLNLWRTEPTAFLGLKKPGVAQVDKEAIERLIEGRAQARARADWAEADRLRQELTKLGVVVEDQAGRTTWRYA
ncbi:MAG: cysteine--tRNA ligase [Deltaproteobacteria bacterium]|jgi:cysteinyl-tRNA synthetase|nr:cysteine--tRNA ligase [Deltaproteobacteria bacterium]